MADVMPDGAGRAGDHGDDRRARWEWPLARRVEQAFGSKPGLERFEPEREITLAGRLDRLDVQLE